MEAGGWGAGGWGGESWWVLHRAMETQGELTYPGELSQRLDGGERKEGGFGPRRKVVMFLDSYVLYVLLLLSNLGDRRQLQ